MNTDHSKSEAKVRAEWTDPVTTTAWRKWHDKSNRFWEELTGSLVGAARLEPGQRILDLAGGTGDPALTLAKMVGPEGQVVMTDISPEMVGIARKNAAREGLNNLEFSEVDAHALPYPDASFDRVTCRLGVMYFWDARQALGEIRRVLKVGGIAAFIAWGKREENEYMRAAMGPFEKRQPHPTPAQGAPHPYRFAEKGALEAELRAAGFSSVHEEHRVVHQVWPGPPEEAWQRLHEISAPMRPYFASFSPETRADAIKEVVVNFKRHYNGKEVITKAPIVVAAAVK